MTFHSGNRIKTVHLKKFFQPVYLKIVARNSSLDRGQGTKLPTLLGEIKCASVRGKLRSNFGYAKPQIFVCTDFLFSQMALNRDFNTA